MSVTLVDVLLTLFTCVAGGNQWLPLQPSCSSLLPANSRQDRHLLHDGPLRSTYDRRLTRRSGTCSIFPGHLEHLSGRYCSGPGHRGRSCFGYLCELSAGAAAGSTAVLTPSNFPNHQHRLDRSLPTAIHHRSRRHPHHEDDYESCDCSLFMSTVWAALG